MFEIFKKKEAGMPKTHEEAIISELEGEKVEPTKEELEAEKKQEEFAKSVKPSIDYWKKAEDRYNNTK